MGSNPRIDDLRKRLERDPGSRLFAQLAEELRKAGDLSGAIDLCREGLQRHPGYPSARMTLGRALVDSGDLQGARTEFEAVLKGAPDNILASRFLGECLEGLGDVPGALARYKATLALAPGDRLIQTRIEAAEARLAGPRVPAATPTPPSLPPEPAEVEESVKPIPLVAADEPFELERPYDRSAPAAALEPTPVEPSFDATLPARGPLTPPSPTVEEMFDFDAPAEAPREAAPLFGVDAAMLSERLPPAEPPQPPPEPPRMLIHAEGEPPPPWVEAPSGPGPEAVPESTPPAAADLESPTLAELYMNQGFPAKAAEVYRQVIAREPGNDRARARLTEIERLVPAEEAAAPAVDTSPEHVREARRWVIQRTIARLEEMRAALRRE